MKNAIEQGFAQTIKLKKTKRKAKPSGSMLNQKARKGVGCIVET